MNTGVREERSVRTAVLSEGFGRGIARMTRFIEHKQTKKKWVNELMMVDIRLPDV